MTWCDFAFFLYSYDAETDVESVEDVRQPACPLPLDGMLVKHVPFTLTKYLFPHLPFQQELCRHSLCIHYVANK